MAKFSSKSALWSPVSWKLNLTACNFAKRNDCTLDFCVFPEQLLFQGLNGCITALKKCKFLAHEKEKRFLTKEDFKIQKFYK